MSLREAAQQALEAMACMRDMVAHPDNLQFIDNAITALRTALAEPEQKTVPLAEYERLQRLVASQGIRLMEYESEPEREPVAWLQRRFVDNFPAPGYETCEATDYGAIPVYTHPPQPVELTDDDLEDIAIAARKGNLTDLRNAIERAHGIGGEE